MLVPNIVKYGATIASCLALYDILSNQFDLPTIGRIVGMSGALMPWWGWLLILQVIFVYGLFEYVRRTLPTPTTVTIGTPEPYEALHREIGHIAHRLAQHEKEIGKIDNLERSLRPQPQGLLTTILTAAPESRLDQIQEEIKELQNSLSGISKKIDEKAAESKELTLSVSRAMRAFHARKKLEALDKTFTEQSERLIDPQALTFASEAAWLEEYERWKITGARIDEVVKSWYPKAQTLLDRPQDALSQSPRHPNSPIFVNTPSILGHTHVYAVHAYYREYRNFMLRTLQEKSQNLPYE